MEQSSVAQTLDINIKPLMVPGFNNWLSLIMYFLKLKKKKI